MHAARRWHTPYPHPAARRTCDRAPEPKSLSTSQCRCAGWSSQRCQPSAKSSAPHTQQLMAPSLGLQAGGGAAGWSTGGGLQRGGSGK